MKTLMMKIMFLNCILTTILKTPMSLMIMLLLQTILSIIIMNKMFITSWYPMIMFLTMIGGLLVIFMYMSSISSNEKFKINFKLLLLILLSFTFSEDMIIEFQINEKLMIYEPMMNMSKMYNKTFMLMMIMTLFLLFSMISINKIIKHYEGPLRSKTYEY